MNREHEKPGRVGMAPCPLLSFRISVSMGPLVFPKPLSPHNTGGCNLGAGGLEMEKNAGAGRRGTGTVPSCHRQSPKFLELEESPPDSIQLTEKKSNPFKESPLSPQECSLGLLLQGFACSRSSEEAAPIH